MTFYICKQEVGRKPSEAKTDPLLLTLTKGVYMIVIFLIIATPIVIVISEFLIALMFNKNK